MIPTRVTPHVLVALFAALASFTSACPAPERGPSERARAVLDTRLPLEGQRLDRAGRLDLAELRGQVVLVDFWASWCGPCRDAMPFYTDLVARYADRGLAIVAVSVDEERALAVRFMAEHAMPFHVIWDEHHRNAERWPIDTMPTSFLVDREGYVRRVHHGFDEAVAARVLADLEALLAAPR